MYKNTIDMSYMYFWSDEGTPKEIDPNAIAVPKDSLCQILYEEDDISVRCLFIGHEEDLADVSVLREHLVEVYYV